MPYVSSHIPALQADASFDGQMYSITLADQSIATGNYEAFYFANPSSSSFVIQLHGIMAMSDQELSLDIIKNVTAFTSTGSLTPNNNSAGSTYSSVINTIDSAVDVSDPVTGGELLYSYRNQKAIELKLVGCITILPGYNVVVRLSVSTNASVTLNFSWWEV